MGPAAVRRLLPAEEVGIELPEQSAAEHRFMPRFDPKAGLPDRGAERPVAKRVLIREQGHCWNVDIVGLATVAKGVEHDRAMDRDVHPTGRLASEGVRSGPEAEWCRAVLRLVQEGDPVVAESGTHGATALTDISPPGRETNRLLANGFTRWGDLYTQRQADVLAQALVAIKQLDIPAAVKDRLAFGVLGAAEMPAFLSRWDRFHLKPFEGLANHRYAQTTLAVEANLLSPVGRGTLPRRLETAGTTLQWLIESCSTPPKVVSTTPGLRGRKRTDWDILVATGSSAKQALRDASVNVVLTDPPYYEDVQYGELARLFHAWLKVYDPALAFDEGLEAVLNPTRGLSGADYENTIAACLKECRRTLKENGTLVLTFHNKNMSAWRALTGALSKAGFVVKALAVVRAENSGDHCKRNVNAMLHDLVLECVPADAAMPTRAARAKSRDASRTSIWPMPRKCAAVPKSAATLEFSPKTPDEVNLAAVGLSLAECVQTGDATRLRELYKQHLARWPSVKPLIE